MFYRIERESVLELNDRPERFFCGLAWEPTCLYKHYFFGKGRLGPINLAHPLTGVDVAYLLGFLQSQSAFGIGGLGCLEGKKGPS